MEQEVTRLPPKNPKDLKRLTNLEKAHLTESSRRVYGILLRNQGGRHVSAA
jgi:hypothetical protein